MGGDNDRIGIAEAASTLAWWLEAGVDTAIAETPRNWLKPRSEPARAAAPAIAEPAPAPAEELPDTLDLFRDWLERTPALPLSDAGA